MLIDTSVVYEHSSNTTPISTHFNKNTKFDVELRTTGGTKLASLTVGLGHNQRIDFLLKDEFEPRKEPYEVICTAKPVLYPGRFTATTELYYLPENPSGGSTVKMDMATGGLLVQRKNENDAASIEGGLDGKESWEPLIPFGFYTSFDDYLAKNFSIMDEAKARGSVSPFMREGVIE